MLSEGHLGEKYAHRMENLHNLMENEKFLLNYAESYEAT